MAPPSRPNGPPRPRAEQVPPSIKTRKVEFNAKKWVNVFPTDGLFDGKREAFRFRTEALPPGAYVLVLKVQDAAGNTGSGDVVFTVPARPVARK